VYIYGEITEVVFSPNRGSAVVEHCKKNIAGYGAWRGSRPGRRPWPCGDRAGILVAPASVVAVAVEGTVLQAWRGGVPRILQAGVSSWSRSGPLPRAVPMPFEGPAARKVRGEYKELAAQWKEQRCARSHSASQVPTVVP
jgi:hypothetical protein